MTLRWSVRAQADLLALTDYYRAIEPDLSIRMRSRVEQTPALLASFPRLGTQLGNSNVRKLRVRQPPYLLFYRIAGDDIFVLRVLHAARDIPS